MYISSLLGGSGWAKVEEERGAAEANEGDQEEEASAVLTTMRPMEEKRGKGMSRSVMRGRERGTESRRKNLDLKKFSKFHRLSHPPGILPGYIQGCSPGAGVPFSHDILRRTLPFDDSGGQPYKLLSYLVYVSFNSVIPDYGMEKYASTQKRNLFPF